MPTPASIALNIFPVTPGPENWPPIGFTAPVRSYPVSVAQFSLSPKLNVTVVTLCTIISFVAIPAHPLPSMKVYVIVCGPIPAIVASKFVPVTPFPE